MCFSVGPLGVYQQAQNKTPQDIIGWIQSNRATKHLGCLQNVRHSSVVMVTALPPILDKQMWVARHYSDMSEHNATWVCRFIWFPGYIPPPKKVWHCSMQCALEGTREGLLRVDWATKSVWLFFVHLGTQDIHSTVLAFLSEMKGKLVMETQIDHDKVSALVKTWAQTNPEVCLCMHILTHRNFVLSRKKHPLRKCLIIEERYCALSFWVRTLISWSLRRPSIAVDLVTQIHRVFKKTHSCNFLVAASQSV